MSQMHQDGWFSKIRSHLSQGIIPEEPQLAIRTVTQTPLYTMMDEILINTGQKGDPPKAVVPSKLKQSMIKEYHSGTMVGHFSESKTCKAMAPQWWWQNMHRNIISYTRGCAQCAIVSGVEKKQLPPLQSISVDHPFFQVCSLSGQCSLPFLIKKQRGLLSF